MISSIKNIKITLYYHWLLEVSKMKKFFKENIVLIVLIALLVGMFIMKNQILSIYNDRHQKVKEIEVLDKNTLKKRQI